MSKKKWFGTWPANCQICNRDLSKESGFIDGATISQGKWALMCTICFVTHGIGLGTGRGQLYDSVTLEKLEG